MKYISLIAVAASALVVGCTIATSERVVERRAPAVSERTVVYTDPAPATTTVYTRYRAISGVAGARTTALRQCFLGWAAGAAGQD